MDMDESTLQRAAEAVHNAEALLITAGAGMGVDSGLPDFRGDRGFWKAYPPLERLGISFVEMANPDWFERDPTLGWGFYGHRLNLYRDTRPHRGFEILRSWGEAMAAGGFVFTSNVDGHFQVAGFSDDDVLECHGSIHHLQCASPCSHEIHDAADIEVEVDPESFRASPPLPSCPLCGGMARPNILMFGDWSWIPNRSATQEQRFARWMDPAAGRRVAVVELGAGTAVPTVRMTSERAASRLDATLVRINLREAQVPAGGIGISSGALEALERIDELVRSA